MYGARPLKRVLQKEVLDRLAMELLEGKFTEGDGIVIDYDNVHIALEKAISDKQP